MTEQRIPKFTAFKRKLLEDIRMLNHHYIQQLSTQEETAVYSMQCLLYEIDNNNNKTDEKQYCINYFNLARADLFNQFLNSTKYITENTKIQLGIRNNIVPGDKKFIYRICEIVTTSMYEELKSNGWNVTCGEYGSEIHDVGYKICNSYIEIEIAL